ncbi:STAS domain-containing protein [Streptomyces sp. NPDC059894]|uniref:STAS domain-containing protein n=1 Tax=unclassified Streptomyces TaxID=2593676 RepID=UPI0036537865
MTEAEGPLAVEITPQSDSAGPVVLRVTGDLDHYTGPGLRLAVDEVLRSPGTGVVADLSGLDYCDSTGLTEIIRAFHRAEAAGVTFSVAGLTPALDRLFRIAGLDELFPLHPAVQDAVDALGR